MPIPNPQRGKGRGSGSLSTIAATNDSSTLSKASSAQLGYFQDSFIGKLAGKRVRRSPIINRGPLMIFACDKPAVPPFVVEVIAPASGNPPSAPDVISSSRLTFFDGYFIRVWAVEQLVRHWLAFHRTTRQSDTSGVGQTGRMQIVSLGAGFDSLYFRLAYESLLDGCVFVEVDMVPVVDQKARCIREHQLVDLVPVDSLGYTDHRGYRLMGHDLNDIDGLFEMLSQDHVGLSPDYPTFILAECVFNYLDSRVTSRLLTKFQDLYRSAMFVLYEQVQPKDAFGGFMMKHFNKIGSRLRSIADYPSLAAERERFQQLNWPFYQIEDMISIYYNCLAQADRDRIDALEPFDEFACWHLTCAHYALCCAGNDRDSFDYVQNRFWYRHGGTPGAKFVEIGTPGSIPTGHQSGDSSCSSSLLRSLPSLPTVLHSPPPVLPPQLGLQRYGLSGDVIDESPDHVTVLVLGGFGPNGRTMSHGICDQLVTVTVHIKDVTMGKLELLPNRPLPPLCVEFGDVVISRDENDPLDLGLLYCSTTSLANGKVLVFGGRRSPMRANPLVYLLSKIIAEQPPDAPGSVKTVFSCERLHFTSRDQSASTEDFIAQKCSRWRHAATLIDREKVVFCGGVTVGGRVLADAFVLDCSSRQLIELPPLPFPLHSHSINVIKKRTGDAGAFKRILAVSGGLRSPDWDPSDCLLTLDDLNTSSGEWTVHQEAIPARYGHCSKTLEDGSLVLIGGLMVTRVGLSPECRAFNGLTVVMFGGDIIEHRDILFGDVFESKAMLVNHWATCFESVRGGELSMLTIGGGGNCFSFGTFLNPSVSWLSIAGE